MTQLIDSMGAPVNSGEMLEAQQADILDAVVASLDRRGEELEAAALKHEAELTLAAVISNGGYVYKINPADLRGGSPIWGGETQLALRDVDDAESGLLSGSHLSAEFEHVSKIIDSVITWRYRNEGEAVLDLSLDGETEVVPAPNDAGYLFRASPDDSTAVYVGLAPITLESAPVFCETVDSLSHVA